jgi:hypothetical protein
MIKRYDCEGAEDYDGCFVSIDELMERLKKEHSMLEPYVSMSDDSYTKNTAKQDLLEDIAEFLGRKI